MADQERWFRVRYSEPLNEFAIDAKHMVVYFEPSEAVYVRDELTRLIEQTRAQHAQPKDTP